MGNFSNLPNELIVQLWGYMLEPEDVNNFAQVSKGVHFLGKPFLEEHRRLKKQYSKKSLSTGPAGCRTAASLLEKMLLNPRIALYTNALKISFWDDRSSEPMPYTTDVMEFFIKTVQFSPILPSPTKDLWIEGILLGSQVPVLGLLAMQLTGIKKFELSGYNKGVDSSLLHSFWSAPQPSKVVTYAASSDAGSSTVGSEGDSDDEANAPRPAILYGIDELSFDHCEMARTELSQMLRCAKDLRSFSYFGPFYPLFAPPHICNALLEYSCDTLKKLHLRSDNYKQCYMGDITRFKNLVEVEADFILLLGRKDKLGLQLDHALPMSIERVTLFVTRPTALVVLERLIQRMIRIKMEYLPNLKVLKFKFSMSEKLEPFAEFEKGAARAAARVGVHLSMMTL